MSIEQFAVFCVVIPFAFVLVAIGAFLLALIIRDIRNLVGKR